MHKLGIIDIADNDINEVSGGQLLERLKYSQQRRKRSRPLYLPAADEQNEWRNICRKQKQHNGRYSGIC